MPTRAGVNMYVIGGTSAESDSCYEECITHRSSWPGQPVASREYGRTLTRPSLAEPRQIIDLSWRLPCPRTGLQSATLHNTSASAPTPSAPGSPAAASPRPASVPSSSASTSTVSPARSAGPSERARPAGGRLGMDRWRHPALHHGRTRRVDRRCLARDGVLDRVRDRRGDRSREVTVAEYVARVLATAPPLTVETADRIAAMLGGGNE